MPNEPGAARKQVMIAAVGTFLGGLALAVALSDAFRQWLSHVISGVARAIVGFSIGARSITLPGWAWIVVAGIVAAVLYVAAKPDRRAPVIVAVSQVQWSDIGDLGQKMMRLLARDKLRGINVSRVVAETGADELLVRQAVDQLVKAGLVWVASGVFGGVLHLTDDGRDLLIAAGLVS